MLAKLPRLDGRLSTLTHAGLPRSGPAASVAYFAALLIRGSSFSRRDRVDAVSPRADALARGCDVDGTSGSRARSALDAIWRACRYAQVALS